MLIERVSVVNIKSQGAEFMKKRAVNQEIDFHVSDFKITARDQISRATEQAFHEEIEIKYLYGGDSAIMVDSKMLIAGDGDIVVVNPYELHSNAAIDGCNGRYYLLMVGLDFFDDIPDGVNLRQFLISDGKKINNHIKGDKRLGVIISRVVEEMREEKPYYRLIVKNLMSEFFALLLRDYVSDAMSPNTDLFDLKSVRVISPALAKIHSAYGEKLKVEELAELCFVSKYHFCRVFKQVMNMTVMQYLIKYRIDMADAMLNSTDKSVGEIIALCGFNDESYFYRCFKRIKGHSPKKRNVS